MAETKVVILCGGRGTRMGQETDLIPKPMVPIANDKPILWHIMKGYAHYGFNNFVLCLGYKGEKIKEYFLNFQFLNSDFTIELSPRSQPKIHNLHKEDWKVTLVDTGYDAMTGSRMKKVEKYIDDNISMMTYGDGVSDVNIHELLDFHKAHRKIATVTGIYPPSRFGELMMNGTRVIEFSEKSRARNARINGGFFVFNRRVFDYVTDDPHCSFEREPLQNIAQDGELMVFPHDGYWQCMDTARDLEVLNQAWNSVNPPWKVWEE